MIVVLHVVINPSRDQVVVLHVVSNPNPNPNQAAARGAAEARAAELQATLDGAEP